MSDERTMQYRPSLDGLRAVAVLMVFAFHAAPGALPGGFIGVDVFFVLSGYLITSILMLQLERRQGGLLPNFYVRRVRRLMPAAITLVTAVVMWESVWGSVLELHTRLREAWATLFYVANWNLIAQSDNYFAEGLAASPLRHMWSLAVEEQFYILWPLLLVGVWALGVRRRGVLWMTAGLAVASAAAMWLMYDPARVSRVYYGTDTRVFQPLIGAVLALLVHQASLRGTPRPAVRRVAPVVAVAALLVLFAAAWRLPSGSARYFHGGAIAVALVAAVLIAALEHPGFVRTGLAWRPVVHLGVISYGIYLWHFPITLWITAPAGSSRIDRAVVVLIQLLLTLAVAEGSYRLIELPIRHGFRVSRRVVGGAAVASLVTAAVVAGVLLSPPKGSLAVAAIKDGSVRACPNSPQPCVRVDGATPDAPTVVVVGDSTAQAYDPAMQVLAKQYGFRYVQAAVGGCPIGHRLLATGVNGDLHKSSNFTCYDNMPGVYTTVLEKWHPALVLATSSNEVSQHMDGDVVVKSGTPEHLAQTKTALVDAVDTLTSGGAKMVLLDLLPTGPSVNCLETSPPTSGRCVIPVNPKGPAVPYNALFTQLADTRDDVYGPIDLTDVVCPNEQCPLVVDGVVVRYDGGHFTATESRRLAPTLDQRLRGIGIDLSHLAG